MKDNNKEKQPGKENCKCAYYKDSCGYLANRYGFLACLVAIMLVVAFFFASYRNEHKASQELILQAHQVLLCQLDSVPTVAESDSVVVFRDVKEMLSGHLQSIDDSLRLQQVHSDSNFSLLTIWASVLMIVFLVFSIYSMFKIDELQKQGRESLQRIDEIHLNARKKSIELEDEVKAAIENMKAAVKRQTDEFEERIKTESRNFNAQVQKYNKELQNTPQQFVELQKKMHEIMAAASFGTSAVQEPELGAQQSEKRDVK